MSKRLRYLLLGLVVLVGIIAAAIAVWIARFDANQYKPEIIRLVQQKTQRNLSIPGGIRLSIFPSVGIDLGRVALSERGSNAPFAEIRSATLSLQLMPLLARRLEVDKLSIDGMRLHLRRLKDDKTNFDDLLSGEESDPKVAFDLDGVSIRNSMVRYEDKSIGRSIEVSDLELESDDLLSGRPSAMRVSGHIRGSSPSIDAFFSLNAKTRLDLPQQQYRLQNIDAQLRGTVAPFRELLIKGGGDIEWNRRADQFDMEKITLDARGKRESEGIELRAAVPQLAMKDGALSGEKIHAEAKLVQGQRSATARFQVPVLQARQEGFKLPSLMLDIAVKGPQLDARAQISGALDANLASGVLHSPRLNLALSGRQGANEIKGTVASPFTANLHAKRAELGAIAATLVLPAPGGAALKLDGNGQAGLDLERKRLTAGWKGRLDDSAFELESSATGFAPTHYRFDAAIDRIDLDRYRNASPAGKEPASAAAETPIDLSAWKDFRAEGSLKIGHLKMSDIKASNVRIDFRSAEGRVQLDRFGADLYGGRMAGTASIAASRTPRFTLHQNLVGIHVGPLLKAATGDAPVEGRGNAKIDLNGTAADAASMKKSLQGDLRLELRDGAVRGVDLAQAVRQAKAVVGRLQGDTRSQAGQASGKEKTDFSELSASFRLEDGVAHNRDLHIKSPLLRVDGTGQLNLVEERLNYLIRATIVPTLKGQGGPELQALKGLTVPIRLSGPYTSIAWSVDLNAAVSDLAERKLDEKKEAVRAQAEKALNEQKDKVRERLDERLKGLLGR